MDCENAHKYGFIVRYPKGKENYWLSIRTMAFTLFRKDTATKVYQSGKTLEEYVGLK